MTIDPLKILLNIPVELTISSVIFSISSGGAAGETVSVGRGAWIGGGDVVGGGDWVGGGGFVRCFFSVDFLLLSGAAGFGRPIADAEINLLRPQYKYFVYCHG